MIYPSVFYKADSCAHRYELLNFLFLAIQLSSSVAISVVTLLSSYGISHDWIISIFLIALLGATLLSFYGRFINKWYLFRALAESTKTITWRFVMCAPPFESTEEDARRLFLSRVKLMLDEYKSSLSSLSWNKDDSFITDEMIQIRGMNSLKKKQLYMSERVEEQQKWYSSKAKNNKRGRDITTGIVVLCIIISFIILYVNVPQVNNLICVAIMLCISCLSWMDAKRYKELYSSYSWTVKDLNLLMDEYKNSCRDISSCVADAENAFSREHSSWLSRKDNS